MLKRFFKDSTIYGLTGILARGVSFLLLPFYTRVLSPTDYGITDILIVFSSLVYVTIALEISQALPRFYTDAESESDKVAYSSTAVLFTLAVYSTFAAIGFLFRHTLAETILGSAADSGLILIMLASVWGQGLLNILLLLLIYQLRSRDYAVTSLTVTFTSILATISFVLLMHWGVAGVLAGQLVGSLIGAGIAVSLTRQSYRWMLDWHKLKEMLSFSFPLVPSSVGVMVAMYIDRFAIKELMTLADVGVFGVAYRLASVVMLLMVSFQSALAPLIYSHYRQTETPSEIARIFRYFVALMLLLFMELSLFANETLLVITTPAFYAAASVVPLLVLSTIVSRMYGFAPGLFIAKRTRAVAIINLAGAGINTLLNFALIPHLGIVGAGLSTCVSAAVTFAAFMILSQNLYYVPHNWKQLGAAAAVAMAIVFGGANLSLELWPGIAAKLLLSLCAVAIFTYLGLVHIQDVRQGWLLIRRRWFSRGPEQEGAIP